MKSQGVQIENTHYFKDSYDSKKRFCSYWHQIDEIRKCKPSNILEVGIGNGFVSSYLKRRGIKVTTCDIDKDLSPDVVGSVLELPFKNIHFDVVACFEVLEHIPYENVDTAISELARVCSNKVILSVPDRNKVFSYLIQIPRVGKIKIHLPIPTYKQKSHKFDGQHYWEIGKKGYSLEKFKNIIRKYGLKIENSYRVFENPSHRFIISRK